MVRLAYISIFAVLGFAGPAASGNAPKHATCLVTAAVTAECAGHWASGNRFLLRGTSAGKSTRVEWRYEFAENRDLQLGVGAASPGSAKSGAIFLIDDRAMLTTGLTLTSGREIDTLGVPVLSLQLVIDLLDRAFPAGPSALHGRQPLDEADNAIPLNVAAHGAKGFVPAPWRVTGAAERLSDTRIAFDLTLAFKPMLEDAEPQRIHFSGFWEKRPAPPALSDATKIEGWAVHRITRMGDAASGLGIGDLRAAPVAGSYSTLGALRRRIADDPHAEER